MGIKSSDIQPAPVAGMKTVLTNSGVLYITDDGKHIIQGPMYDVSGTAPVNVTNKMLLKQFVAVTTGNISKHGDDVFFLRRFINDHLFFKRIQLL
ncbi:disulfide isomerase DsbC N-terminal domain-containing protein [Escherichia coli]